MGKVKCKALHQTIPSSKKNSMKGKRTRFKQKKPPLKKSSSRKGKMKELLVKKKTRKETQGKIEPPQTRSTKTKGKLLNHSASDADTKIEDVISMHLQVKER